MRSCRRSSCTPICDHARVDAVPQPNQTVVAHDEHEHDQDDDHDHDDSTTTATLPLVGGDTEAREIGVPSTSPGCTSGLATRSIHCTDRVEQPVVQGSARRSRSRPGRSRRRNRWPGIRREGAAVGGGHDTARGLGHDVGADGGDVVGEVACRSGLRRPRRTQGSRSGNAASAHKPGSTYASSWPVTIRVMSKVQEPRSK